MEENSSNIIDNRLFWKGQMSLDASPEYQENGTYGRATNINPVNYDGNWVGTLTNVKGNALIEYTFEGLTSNPYIKAIGSKLDEKRRRMYWLIYAQNNFSDQYAYVIYYSYETQEITTVFSHENILDFNPDFVIDNVEIAYDDELGDTLSWSDGNSEPKKLNVTAGFNRFNNYTDNTSGFTTGDIVFADGDGLMPNILQFIPCRALTSTSDYPSYSYTTGKLDSADWETLAVGQCYPPFLVPTMFYQKPTTPYWSANATYTYDDGSVEVEGVSSFLRRRSFQFAYSYIYFDGQQSELSPFSEAVFSQELTSGLFTTGGSAATPDFPTPLAIKVKVPIHFFRYTDIEDVESVVEMPTSMIARVKLYIREVPTRLTPTDWNEWADIPYEDFYKYDISSGSISQGFPVAGDAGTYYYNWFSTSYGQAPSGQISQATTITVEFDGTQALLPVDIKYASTNFFPVPKRADAQTIIDNRKVWAGVTDGMDISRDVIESLEENISITRRVLNPEISSTPTVTTINKFNASPTSVSVNNGVSDSIITIVYDFQSLFDVNDFDADIGYSFIINVVLFAPPLQPIPLSFTIDGFSNGIPTDADNFNEFISDAIEDSLPGSFFDLVVGNNSTGQTTIQLQVPISIISSATSEIVANDGFYKVETYLPYRSYKNHTRQQFGFVLKDETGRQTPTITGDWATVDFPHFLNDDLAVQTFLANISGLGDISLPQEARCIDIVRKRSDSYQNYIQFALSSTNTVQESWNWDAPYEIGFVNLELDEPDPVDLANNKNLYISLNSVNGGDGYAYESTFDTSILAFAPQSGDVLRFLYKMDSDGVIDEIYEASFNIEKYDERTNTVVVNFKDIEDNEPNLATFLEDSVSSVEWTVRVMCEIIQKPKVSEESFYWEVAAQLSCTNGSVDIGTAGNISIFGDAYLKLRGYCVDNDNANPTSEFQNFILQDPNFNDFAPTNNLGEGRPNKNTRTLRRGQNEYTESKRGNLLRYSEQSIQNTDVRRYGTVYDENIQEVDNVFGDVEKLHGEGDVLNIYQEDKISRILVGRSVTTELSGGQRVIASQNNVFSDVVYNNFNGGISLESESFAVAGYQKYFTDSKRGKVYRQSLDGITAISEVGLSGEFKNIFRKVRNSFTQPIVRGIVDERTDEYILSITYSEDSDVTVFDAAPLMFSFNPPADGVDYTVFFDDQDILIDTNPTDKYSPEEFSMFSNQAENGTITVSQKPGGTLLEDGDTIRVNFPKNVTLVFSERTGGWTTFLGYTAEWLESGIQSYHTFFNGQMWLHDLGNTNYNTFFGTLTDSDVEVFGNKAPERTKYWRNIAAKTKAENIEIEELGITTSEEQVSHLPAAMFENREGTRHAPFLGEGEGTEVNTGIKLRGRWIKTKLTLPSDPSDNREFKLFGVAYISGDSGLTY